MDSARKWLPVLFFQDVQGSQDSLLNQFGHRQTCGPIDGITQPVEDINGQADGDALLGFA
jgi:hypothetical protein